MYEMIDDKKRSETGQEILERRRKEFEEIAAQREIDQREIEILMQTLDARFEQVKPGEGLTAEGAINELKDLLLNKYYLTSKSALSEILVCLYAVLEL